MALGHERFENVLQPHFGGISTFAIASPDAVIIIGGGIFFSLLCTRNKTISGLLKLGVLSQFINHTLGVTRDDEMISVKPNRKRQVSQS